MDAAAFSDLKSTLENELGNIESELVAIDLQRQQLIERKTEVISMLFIFHPTV